MLTIGYEGRTLETYLESLLEAGVTVLCDVRHSPISRKPGFSKKSLKQGCEGVGIRYEHLPELGIATDKRKGLRTRADYDALFAEYERKWLPKQGDALAKIRDWVKSGERVALTCLERDAIECHRHRVTEELARRFGDEFRARDL